MCLVWTMEVLFFNKAEIKYKSFGTQVVYLSNLIVSSVIFGIQSSH